MDLRLKLALIFVSMTLIGFVLFGAVAYTGARDLGERNEIALLHNFNATLMRITHPGGRSVEELRAELLTNLPPQLNDVDIPRVGILDLAQPAGPIETRIASELAAGKAHDGAFQLDGERHAWAATPLDNQPYFLYSIRRSTADDLEGYVNSIATPLGIAMLIVLWLVFWVAIILGTLFRKVNEQKEILQHQARHDTITELPNHHALMESLTEAMKRESPNCIGLCVLDLNRFKDINDSLGRDRGDELLRQVGHRIGGVLRAGDHVARVGGDEFAIMLSDIQPQHLESIAEKLLHAMRTPFEVSGHNLYMGCTLGMALYPTHASDAASLAQRAEIAMYNAKHEGTDFGIFNTHLDQSSIERLALVNDLRDAIEHGHLQLYYQPQLDLRSNTIIGVEALARWIHPKKGFIPPDQFIVLAEQSGLIRPLTTWVLEAAFRQWNEWRKMGLRLNISVNLSAWNLQDPKLEQQVRELLRRWGMPPSQLELEITETAMMTNPAHAMEILNTLDTLGIRISVDDFGTGYSSLSYLKKLPVDEIKIDKSFVLDMIEDEEDASIVRATVGLAHDLGLSVVAEGIESEAALQLLRDYGCDRAQGYFISRPLPVEQLDGFLKTSLAASGHYKAPAIVHSIVPQQGNSRPKPA